MDKTRGISHKKQIKTNFMCIPRLAANSSSSNKAKVMSPMTLLQRLREAVFRLIMFSALSKATTTAGTTHVRRSYSPTANDPCHSEAVADCIEFIKKKASPEGAHRNSNASTSSSMDASPQGVVHLPCHM